MRRSVTLLISSFCAFRHLTQPQSMFQHNRAEDFLHNTSL